jgi:hypothetical protein
MRFKHREKAFYGGGWSDYRRCLCRRVAVAVSPTLRVTVLHPPPTPHPPLLTPLARVAAEIASTPLHWQRGGGGGGWRVVWVWGLVLAVLA